MNENERTALKEEPEATLDASSGTRSIEARTDIEPRADDAGIRSGAPAVSGLEAPSAEADRRQADEFVAGGKLDTKLARELERRLAKRRDEKRVQSVRKRRVQMDRARTIEVLSSAARAEPDELLELAKSLKQYKDTGHARRLLVLACERVTRDGYPKIYTKIFQQAALCTYKDPDLPLDWKLERAIEILGETESLSETRDPETLGLAGAIFKRKWELDGRRQNLERALFYYLKGYALGAPLAAQADVTGHLRANPGFMMNAGADQGYTGINAAFVLDLLAAQEEEEAQRVGFVAPAAAERREQARLIREEIARSVPALLAKPENMWLEDEWWYYATVGEALFGLGRYSEALEWLIAKPQRAGLQVAFDVESSAGLQVPEWEYESTARQLAQLARIQCDAARAKAGVPGKLSEAEFEATDAARALHEFLGGEDKAVRSAFRGRFGLGLSGGGFRASFFHIGVLARLAEIDALRHVEVLSCVSGGSIVGAHYYLEVRKLLQTKTDTEIRASDYVEIVKRMQAHFLEGVQRNIRTRVLAELSTNLKMIFRASYSRTLRVGELYERELYAKVADGDDGTGPFTGPRWLPDAIARALSFKREKRLLKDLKIFPKIGVDAAGKPLLQSEFKPRSDNWRRQSKAPILVLNACSLNTGHNWQFTATYMGEPPLPIQAEIDCNYRLRRFYYEKAPANSAPITLGQAVAASSCVPGLFEPIALDDLYPEDTARQISVRLVDGGVCDNQGIASLLEQDCTVMLVSDGSGQMDTQDVPSAGVLGVPLRSNGILQARVREAQYADIASRRRANLLRGLMFVHLKQDLAGKALAWRNCPPDEQQSDVYDSKFDVRAEKSGMTSYGIRRDVQGKLAAVRTDLDSFCDAEAYALMTSGYQMAAAQFRGLEPSVEGFSDPAAGEWPFLAIAPALAGGEHKARLEKLLDAAKSSAFKVWQLLPALIALKWAIVATALASVVFLFVERWNEPLIPESVHAWANTHLTFQSVAAWAGTALGVTLVALVVNAVLGKARGKSVMRAIRWRDTLKDIAIGLVMSLVGWLLARLHLHVFDRLYLRHGKIDRFSK